MSKSVQHIIRIALQKLRGNTCYAYPPMPPIMPAEDTQERISRLLKDDKPCMIARFGSVELEAVVSSMYPSTVGNAIRFVRKQIPAWGYSKSIRYAMRNNAGFFPATPAMLDRFGVLMQECMKEADVLGSWRQEEAEVIGMMPQCTRVPLYSLEPYYFEHTWMPALEGKKVLVIHPFAETIHKQHARLDKLFANPEMAPKYELKTIKAVQSIAGNQPEGFNDWFEALEWMKREIDKIDFDIAIIGCGAYGFPLAAYVKQIGKKAIHLGGAVANLYGIESNMVDRIPKLRALVNEYWVRPSESERPKGADKIENSLYW